MAFDEGRRNNPPEYLNKDFLERILRKDEDDQSLKISKFKIIPGSKKGDNYMSLIFKISVDYSSKRGEVKDRRLLVKIAPTEEGADSKKNPEAPLFLREIQMYSKVLPEMRKIMKSVGDDEEMAPKMLHYSEDPLIIVFEDITERGFVMQPTLHNFDNTAKIVKKLAKFHAVSFYMNDNKYVHRLDLTEYKPVVSQSLLEKFKMTFDGFDVYLKEVVDTWPGYEKVSEKLVGLTASNLIERLINVYQQTSDYNVLCHGDFHFKNMMVVKKEEKIDKSLLLDYQFSHWGSPAIDLFYAFYLVGDSEVLLRRGELLSVYYETFCEYLNRLGCLKKPPSLLDLNLELLRKGQGEVFSGVSLFPLLTLDMSSLDQESVVNPTPEGVAAMKRAMFSHERIMKTYKILLPELLHKGIL